MTIRELSWRRNPGNGLIHSININMNGETVDEYIPNFDYFEKTQPTKCMFDKETGLYNYSFSINPGDYEPSDRINCSKLSNVSFQIPRDGDFINDIYFNVNLKSLKTTKCYNDYNIYNRYDDFSNSTEFMRRNPDGTIDIVYTNVSVEK